MIELEIGNGLRVKINEDSHTSSIISSPKATGNVIIPKYAEFECSQYNIISIEKFAFRDTDIKSLSFPEDSLVESFESCCFYSSKVQKIQIPSSLKYIKEGCFDYVQFLCDIDVSKRNNTFLYAEKKYLVGKSEDSTQYDILYYVRCDIRKAVIPSEIKIIQKNAIQKKQKLSTLEFLDNPEYPIIGPNVFSDNPITKLIIPDTTKEIDPSNFDGVVVLTKIKISSNNKNFLFLDKKILLTKSEGQSEGQIFDKLIFARRDIDSIVIPSYIKEIAPYAFRCCNKLKSIQFEENSVLCHICHHAFSFIPSLGCITIPASVRQVDYSAFYGNDRLMSITFLGSDMTVDLTCAFQCPKLVNIYFNNARNLTLEAPKDLFGFAPSCSIRVRSGAKISGTAVENCKGRFH